MHLVAVIAVTKMNANPLETLLTSMNAPVAFTGFLVALLILSPEGLGALKAVLNNQVQRAMNLFFGSVLATISLTVPVVTLIAFLTGNELRFGLGAPEMVVMVASLVPVPYLLLHRAHQCAERRGPPGAVRRLSDDHFRLTPLTRPAESGRKKSLPVLTPAGFFCDAVRLTCWYPARRSFSPDRQSLSSA
ncbi:calcium/proton exchanger [Klebsiella aerogenes]|nr:calcium/proton exchanger [Klebsiella aerogenes]